ncbi:thioesterase family protein [Alteromonas pelagimontana]|uniref:Thioesterase family protein n=1 Tax=Alteromonas pelagimontana TaxID=1858656 RepID=A0A6M4MA90_9ALTE|nr:thioesterase family protein [Alteromonas pelagimontana]QJR79495.1 thioesterase family protein [Alteromonas pelagimontana]
MTVDELLTLPQAEQVTDAQWRVNDLVLPKSWTQGRTIFGGISAGMVYSAIRQQVDEDRLLRSLTTNFIGPLLPEVSFSITVTLLRQGKNVTQITGEAIQNGKVCVFCQACFGQVRQSKIKVSNTDTHQMPLPEKARFIPQIPKVTPKFLQHFDLCIQSGGIPFTGKKDTHYHGFMRFTKPPAAITDAHVITMIDAWPPAILQLLRWPAPASTVSWNLEFIYPHRVFEGTDWFAYQAHTRQAADGYGHTEATIWDKNNEVIALSRQTVAVFD